MWKQYAIHNELYAAQSPANLYMSRWIGMGLPVSVPWSAADSANLASLCVVMMSESIQTVSSSLLPPCGKVDIA